MSTGLSITNHETFTLVFNFLHTDINNLWYPAVPNDWSGCNYIQNVLWSVAVIRLSQYWFSLTPLFHPGRLIYVWLCNRKLGSWCVFIVCPLVRLIMIINGRIQYESPSCLNGNFPTNHLWSSCGQTPWTISTNPTRNQVEHKACWFNVI